MRHTDVEVWSGQVTRAATLEPEAEAVWEVESDVWKFAPAAQQPDVVIDVAAEVIGTHDGRALMVATFDDDETTDTSFAWSVQVVAPPQ